MVNAPPRLFMGESLEWVSPVRVGSHVVRDWFLGRAFRVDWWTSPVSPVHFFRPRSFRQSLRKARRHLSGGEDVPGRGRVVTPRVLIPARRIGILDTAWAARAHLRTFHPDPREAMRASDLVWVSSYFYLPFLEDAPRVPRVVRLADLDILYPDHSPAVERWIRSGLAAADLVLTPTKAIDDWARSAGSRRVLFWPNGVEYEPFAQAASAGRPRDRGIVLFVGAINELLDQELVASTAAHLPAVRFQFIGPVAASVAALRRAANVELLGPRPYEELPGRMASAGACWIPFRRTPRSDTARPLKLFQYLAAGAPVACTPWKELSILGAPVTLASTAEEMAAALQAALAGGETGAEARQAFAREQSWNARFKELERALAEILAARGPSGLFLEWNHEPNEAIVSVSSGGGARRADGSRR